MEKDESNVHRCELIAKSNVTVPIILAPVIRSSRLREKWKSWCSMSEKHPMSYRWAGSFAAVRKEKKRQCQMSNWWIIHPFSAVRLRWETVMTIIYSISFITIPLMTCFVVLDPEAIRLDNLNLAIYIFFWMDIILNSFTSVSSEKNMIMSMNRLSASLYKYYLKGYFFLDILSSLPYDRITYQWRKTPGEESSIIIALINLLPLIKISRYFTFNSYVYQLFMHLQLKKYHYQMFSTFVLSVYIIHWFVCLCYATPVLFMYFFRITVQKCEDCWVSNIPKNSSLHSKYRHALFIVIQNLVASGFGGIEPRTQGHTIICTILMFLGRIFECYVVVMFLQIRTVSKAAELKYEAIMDQLTAYTRQKQLPAYMKTRLSAYYHHRFRNSYFQEKTILASLSEQLRQEILLYSGKRLVENVAVFRSLPKDILISIVAHLKFELYLPNDVIVKAGTQGDCMFFLANGTVAVLTPTGKEVCHLEDGTHFGEVALLVQDQRRVASILAVDVCEVYRLERRDFRKCITAQSELFNKIERIASERMERILDIEEQHKHYIMKSKRITRIPARMPLP